MHHARCDRRTDIYHQPTINKDTIMNNFITRKNVATHPELKRMSLGTVPVTYSRHAIIRSNEKRIRLKDSITIDGNVVESEYKDGRLIKLVVREKYNETHDLVMVVVQGGHVPTVWLNKVSDTHKTLDKKRIGRVAC